MVTSSGHAKPAQEQMAKALGIAKTQVAGSAGVKIGLVAQGLCDLYVHINPTGKGGRGGPWDLCAPEIIAREAGGMFTDLQGNTLKYDHSWVWSEEGIVVSNGLRHKEIIAQIGPIIDTIKG